MVEAFRAITLRLRTSATVRRVDQTQQSLVDFRRGYRYANRLSADSDGYDYVRSTTSLEDYFDNYTEGPGVWKWRHYFEIYERHLARFCGEPVRVLEIGVFGGGSLLMWRDYFGADCRLYGVDIDPSCEAYESDTVDIFIGDQSDPRFWRRVLDRVPQFDVVLDDGGHRAHQQIATLEAVLPSIAPGGVYLCEDIIGPMHAFHAYLDGFTRPLSDIVPVPGRFPASNMHRQVASVHRYPLVTVIEKPRHTVTHFEAPRRGTAWPTPASHQARAGQPPKGRWAAAIRRVSR